MREAARMAGLCERRITRRVAFCEPLPAIRIAEGKGKGPMRHHSTLLLALAMSRGSAAVSSFNYPIILGRSEIHDTYPVIRATNLAEASQVRDRRVW